MAESANLLHEALNIHERYCDTWILKLDIS